MKQMAERIAETIVMSASWNEAFEIRGVAFSRGDLATNSFESYTLDEMRKISETIDASTTELEAAMREDFNSMPTELQSRMMDLLRKADPGNVGWWQNLLLKQEA